ncbi:MAG: hypothetical protein H6540_00450 [Bacteroidales bacterium]|nr:hypothetical protein [Bacteroidales bacterium]MCB9013925.1 hypothetical protein [Bacteroidales bacterium]
MNHKKTIPVIFFLLMLLFLGTSASYGQKENPGRDRLSANLTAEQKALLEANRSSITETREAFKASLTADQLRMLKDNSLSIDQKREGLKSSLNAEQKQLLNQNRQLRMMQRQQFRSSLTYQQKQMIRRAYIYRTNNTSAHPGMRRLPKWRRR